jgi:hypothetical protein
MIRRDAAARAPVAEPVDAADSKSVVRKDVGVRVSPGAPILYHRRVVSTSAVAAPDPVVRVARQREPVGGRTRAKDSARAILPRALVRVGLGAASVSSYRSTLGWANAGRTLIAAELVFGVNSGSGGGQLTLIPVGIVVEIVLFRAIERRTIAAGACGFGECRAPGAGNRDSRLRCGRQKIFRKSSGSGAGFSAHVNIINW